MTPSQNVELDLVRFELRRAGKPIKLEKQPFELLTLLAERRDQLVTRDEIAERLWGKGVFVETEQSIHSAIRKIRLALDDDPQSPRFVQTVVGKGYRLIARIKVISSPDQSRPSAISVRRFGRWRAAAIAASTLLILAVGFVLVRRSPSARDLRSPHIRPDAYDAYLRGRYFFDQRTPDSFEKSIAYFRKSIALDPQFAPAYAGLAASLPALCWFSGKPVNVMKPEAMAAARRAIELDPNLGEAHSALGTLLAVNEWNWTEARRELERGVALSPNSAMAHQQYANWLQATGRLQEALRESGRAQQLEPLSFFMNRQFGYMLVAAHRYEEALRLFQRAEELQPHSSASRRCIGLVYEFEGKRDDAIATELRVLADEGISPAKIEALRAAYARSGWSGYWTEVRRLQLPGAHANAYSRALIEARLGHGEAAWAWMEKSAERHELWSIWIKTDPLLDNVRNDPGYLRLLRRMNLDHAL